MKNQLNRLSEYVARWLSSAFKQQYQNDQYQSSQPLSSPQKLGSDLDHQRQAELQFRSALDNAPTLIWMSDPEAQCTYFNQTWLTFTGRSLKQELGTGWLAGVHPDDYQQCIDTYLSAFEARQPFTIEHRLRRASGEYRWVLNNGAPHCLENHEFIGYIGSCVDITDLKQATLQTASHAGSHMLYDSTHPDGSIHSSLSQGEPVLAAHGQVSQQGETRQDITMTKLTETSLSEWEEQNQAILSAIPDILAVISSEGIYLNYSYNQFSGQLIQPETIDPTGLHVSEVLPPEVASMCLAAVRQALETGEIQIYEQPVQCGDIIQSEETRVVPYQADKVLCIVRNISDRQQIENSLHPSKARQHALVQALPDLIMRLSRDGIYLDFFSNSDFQGIEAQDTLFDTHASLPPDLAQRRCNAIQTALETGELQIYEHEIWLDGTLRIEECRVIPCHDDQVLVIGRDITDRKRSTAQLAIQNELLARIARGEPLANILDTLVQKIEQNLPGALCSIMLLDDMNCLQLHAGQSLPQTYTQRLYNLPIGEGRGSCGTAAFRQQTVITADIATDPLWAAYRQKPLEHGLKACWSTPIVTADDRVLGVFGVYYQTVRSPLPDELEILGQIANIAGIAIEREQAEARIRQSEEQLRLTEILHQCQ
ncbi:MAG TPA: PAS domain-containing protein [Leptolyngbyaceae cyanobacterium M33_DOE_097]|uniref:histidine kinase n=1 Tax=Oscillatoriales cyanobacterium SpSt-418 TaxID=2282169 RepID=A0A7C3KJ22_9CYAN|nr:PAS domain-containing protein [Leptolyngbyaceae cyanobacterium M33_DOE_097]